ncbi:hypothetical protein NQZ68_016598 [Dissostichus eleginoides]|nr:hypothetical protein NQZ68_016598 [Dissostichus eleginoides]
MFAGPARRQQRQVLLLADNLHDHLKSPQDPYVVVVLSSLCLSSVYRMPFHLAACCSRTRENVGVAVLKACPVSHPIRCCSHNRPPLGSSALGMSKSYIGIKHRAGLTNRRGVVGEEKPPVLLRGKADKVERVPV